MATTTERKIYVGLGLLVALGAGVYFVQKQDAQEQKRLTTGGVAADMPGVKLADDDAEKLTKIEIANADKPPVTLEKKGDEWRVTKPVDYRANQGNVKSLIDNLKELKAKELIDPNASAYGEYGLDDAKAVHLVAYKGDEKAADLYFGKSGGRGQMARVAGRDGVYAIGGYSPFQYTRDVKTWRDAELVKLDDTALTRVDLDNENGKFAFKKEGDLWSATFKDKPIERYDESKVKDMVRAFKSLNAEDFADAKPDGETGLDKPAATATFTLKEGEPVKLLFGKTSTGESRYARRDGNPQTFIVSSWASGWAVAKPEKFQKPDEKKAGAAGAASASKATMPMGAMPTGSPHPLCR